MFLFKSIGRIAASSLLITLSLTSLSYANEEHDNEFDAPKIVIEQPATKKAAEKMIDTIIDESDSVIGLVAQRKGLMIDMVVYFSAAGAPLAYTQVEGAELFGSTEGLFSFKDGDQIGFSSTSGLHDLEGKLACKRGKPIAEKMIPVLPKKVRLSFIPSIPPIPALGAIKSEKSDLSCTDLLRS